MLKRGLLIAASLIMVAGAIHLVAHASTGTTVPGFTPSSIVSWPAVTQDVTGATEASVQYEVGLVATTQDLTVPGTVPVLVVPLTAPQWNIGQSLAGLPAGSYRVFVRSIDGIGNTSPWSSEFLEGPLAAEAPPVTFPVGTKMTLNIEILPTSPPGPYPVGTKIQLTVQVVNT